jgi:hypothetical protein
VNIRAY